MSFSGWCQKLNSCNQAHLLENSHDWTDEQKNTLVADLQSCDSSYPGGLSNYISRAKEMLATSASGVNAFEGYEPHVPITNNLDPTTPKFLDTENTGLKHLHEMSYVLVAGGLGERLGYPGIKVSLPTDVVSGKTYLQYYCEYIIALDQTASRIQKKVVTSPLAIMTSGDTHDRTTAMLEENNYYGLKKDQITIMKQEKVPALLNADAKFAQDSETKGLILKPHGHGDVHQLLIQHGLHKKWTAEGKKYMLFFQDTNALVFRILCATLGDMVDEKLMMSTICIPRKAEEAVGGICKLKKNGEEITLNVEYNQLGPMLVACGLGGDVADPATGNSKYPGNTNALLFYLPRYCSVMDETGGNIPEFVNPKYTDSTKTAFKSPTRLECMMQEYPRLLKSDDKVGCVETERFLCFSTVKNHVTDAVAKVAAGNTPECAFSAESDLYYSNAKLLELAAKNKGCKVDIAGQVDVEYLGVKYPLGPKVVLAPSFGVCLSEIQNRIKEGSSLVIHQGSAVILEGEVSLDGLDIQGAIHASGNKNITNLLIRNEGIILEKVGDDAPLELSVRGYKASKKDVHVI